LCNLFILNIDCGFEVDGCVSVAEISSVGITSTFRSLKTPLKASLEPGSITLEGPVNLVISSSFMGDFSSAFRRIDDFVDDDVPVGSKLRVSDGGACESITVEFSSCSANITVFFFFDLFFFLFLFFFTLPFSLSAGARSPPPSCSTNSSVSEELMLSETNLFSSFGGARLANELEAVGTALGPKFCATNLPIVTGLKFVRPFSVSG
uniref:Secreted protein n=1 Tax=Haemonchus placei TaxID=6290 RepID=A0A0N4WP14_HAEPC